MQLPEYYKRSTDNLSRIYPDSFNIGVNVNKAAGQNMFHCHMYLMPCYKGDVENSKGGSKKCDTK